MVSSVDSISFEPSVTSLGSRGTKQPHRADAAPRAVPDFLFGPENALLDVSIRPLVRSGECAYRPLVLVGPSGVGKSHLAAGVAAVCSPDASTIQISAADFARQTTETTDPVTAAEHHRALHSARMLIFENLQHLVKKDAAQRALVSLIDSLVQQQATVVITSNSSPAKLPNMSPALVDRLSAGLLVSLSPPSPAVRRAMVRHIADREQLDISARAADRLAAAPLVSWNELRGALLELRFATGVTAAIRLTDVKRYLAEQPETGAPAIRDIALAVAKRFGVRLSDLRGPTRRRGVVEARNITAFLARKGTSLSLQRIGNYLGGRDHTTILHGIRQAERRMAEDPARRQLVENLMESISPQCRIDSWKNCHTAVGETLLDGD